MFEPNTPAAATQTSARDDDQKVLAVILATVRGLAESKLSKCAAVASIAGVLLALLPFVPGRSSRPQPAMAESLQLTQPPDGATVGPTINVRGKASRDGARLNYYLIVTPPQGAAQIEPDPMDMSPEGELSGRAVLGTGSVGVGQTFIVEILASTTALKSLRQVPPGAKWSNAIRVVRKY